MSEFDRLWEKFIDGLGPQEQYTSAHRVGVLMYEIWKILEKGGSQEATSYGVQQSPGGVGISISVGATGLRTPRFASRPEVEFKCIDPSGYARLIAVVNWRGRGKPYPIGEWAPGVRSEMPDLARRVVAYMDGFFVGISRRPLNPLDQKKA
jgi:hypothetical protein